MRAFSYAWSLRVTWQRWRSHHSIRHSQKLPATRKHHGSMFYGNGVMAARSFSLREYGFFIIFAPVTLTLIWWPSYTNLTRRDIPDVWNWTSYVKSFESHITVCEWVHLVTHCHLWSRDKNGGHIIQSVIARNYMTQANYVALSFTEPEVCAIEVLHCRKKAFQLFCSYDLDGDPMTFIHELDPYSLEIHRMCIRQGFRKLSSDR